LGPALLPQSLQEQLPCENGKGPSVHEKVVWRLALEHIELMAKNQDLCLTPCAAPQ